MATLRLCASEVAQKVGDIELRRSEGPERFCNLRFLAIYLGRAGTSPKPACVGDSAAGVREETARAAHALDGSTRALVLGHATRTPQRERKLHHRYAPQTGIACAKHVCCLLTHSLARTPRRSNDRVAGTAGRGDRRA